MKWSFVPCDSVVAVSASPSLLDFATQFAGVVSTRCWLPIVAVVVRVDGGGFGFVPVVVKVFVAPLIVPKPLLAEAR